MQKEWWRIKCQPANQLNPEVRHPASQTARLSLLDQQDVWSLTMWLVHSRIASRKATCQSFRNPSSQSTHSPVYHPASHQPFLQVLTFFFVFKAFRQLNIVPSNPTHPQRSGSANQTNKILNEFVYYTLDEISHPQRQHQNHKQKQS